MVEVIKILLDVIVMLTSIPIGYFLAWLCKDEIVYRKWIFVIFYSFVVVFIVAFIFFSQLSIILSLVYMIIVTLISILKSKDKKFLKN